MGVYPLDLFGHPSIITVTVVKQTGRTSFGPSFTYMHEQNTIDDSKTHGRARSGQWPRVRGEFLASNGKCAACGSTKDLQAHHVVAFHTRPELELEPSNLIALCEGMERNCHRFVGHLDDFSSINERSREDAASWISRIIDRPSWDPSKSDWVYPHE